MLIRVFSRQKSQQGSSLIMVLLILSVLSILGIAIIGVSVMNFKVKMADRNSKESFYAAEARFQEAQAVIGQVIEEAIDAGNDDVNARLVGFISNERAKEASDPLNEDTPIINGIDGLGSINDTELKNQMNYWFQDTYKDYFNNIDFIDIIDNHTFTGIDSNIDNSDLSVTVVNTINYNKADQYQITLEFTSNHKDIQRIIRGTFDIGVPTYKKPYLVSNQMKSITENVLWTKPITTEGNVYVLGNDVTVNGDIYAYGFDENNIKGGVIVGNDRSSGSVKINGNVYTNEYLYTNKSNSGIIVNGDVFCNTLSIPKKTKECSIVVNNGSVNTLDDIELNGESGNIVINGSYYGFSDGTGINVKHDMSSSIVINSDDIGKNHGSSIIVTGNPGDNNSPMNSYISNNQYESGVFIGGTVYVDLDNSSKKYQTGESLAIKGNYKAYSEKLIENPNRPADFQPLNITLGSYQPLVLVSKLNERDPSAYEKSEYFSYYDVDYPGELRLGNEGIELNSMKYSLGAYINEGQIFPNSEEITTPEWEDLKDSKEKDYKYLVNKLGDLGLGSRNNPGNPDDVSNLDLRVHIFNNSGIDGRFNFNSDKANNGDFHLEYDKSNNSLLFVNSNPNKDIFLTDKASNTPKEYNSSQDERVVISNEENIGIIITKGNVYISGTVKYRGVIAAEGNITFVDDNPKSISNTYYTSNDMFRIVEMVYQSNILRDNFVDLKNARVLNYLVNFNTSNKTNVQSIRKFEDLVDVRWHRVK